MIIDFHTHIFPEKIAAKAVQKLSSCIHLEPAFNGCAQGLIESMNNAGIDKSVILPVVTAPAQFDSILRFAAYINETTPELISLAGIHPESADWKEQLNLIAREGFKGVKVHPNYQGVLFNDVRFKRILYRASELGLFLLTHAGYDPYTPDEEFCTPDMILEVVNEVKPEKLVLAHMGSNMYYDEAEEKLCGLDVYFDTAYSIYHMKEEQFVRMVRKHGADKVLFASDCPWSNQKTDVEILKNCALTEAEKEKIFYKNAQSLLGL